MSILDRYIARAFLGILAPTAGGLVFLYLLVDLAERMDILLRNDASASAAVRYFLFKIPLIVTQTLPAALLVAAIVSVGLFARHREMVALRASGVSLARTVRPILVAALLSSVALLVWNDAVVPPATHISQQINRVEIRKRANNLVWNNRQIWLRGSAGLYSIDYIDSADGSLVGLTIYEIDATFSPRRVIEIGHARWVEGTWRLTDAVAFAADRDGHITPVSLPADANVLPETPNDFREARVDPEELSYSELGARIARLASRGISTRGDTVELSLKLAIPFSTFFLVWVGVALAARVQNRPNMTSMSVAGIALGFGYWAFLAFCKSLGESGALHPTLAAWTPNAVLALLGGAVFARGD